MTHSHDRTLLASLGFADPDKRDSNLHTLACEYLTEDAQSGRLVRLVNRNEELISVESRVEVPLSKGEGQYRTTIGFLDAKIDWVGAENQGSVFVEVKINRIDVGDVIRQINLYRQYAVPWTPPLDSENFGSRLAARDKKQAMGTSSWILAANFELDDGYTKLLLRENIVHIQLGEGFRKWYEERLKRPAPKAEQF